MFWRVASVWKGSVAFLTVLYYTVGIYDRLAILRLQRLLARPPAVSSLRSPSPPHTTLAPLPNTPTFASLALPTPWRSDSRLRPQTATDGHRGRIWGRGLKRPERSDSRSWPRTASEFEFEVVASNGLGVRIRGRGLERPLVRALK